MSVEGMRILIGKKLIDLAANQNDQRYFHIFMTAFIDLTASPSHACIINTTSTMNIVQEREPCMEMIYL
jgi:hypothetical protein